MRPARWLAAGILLAAAEAAAQPTWVLQLEKDSHLGHQTLLVGPDLQELDALQWSGNRKFVHSLQGGNGRWVVLASGGTPFAHQSLRFSDKLGAASLNAPPTPYNELAAVGFNGLKWGSLWAVAHGARAQEALNVRTNPRAAIEQQHSLGMALSHLAHDGNQWTLVFTETPLPVKLLTGPGFPRAQVQELLGQGWRMALARFEQNEWWVVLQQQAAANPVKLLVSDTLPLNQLYTAIVEGYALTCVGAGAWNSPSLRIDTEDLEQPLLFAEASSPEWLRTFIKVRAPSDAAWGALQRLMAPQLEARQWTAARDTLLAYATRFPQRARDAERLARLLSLPATDAGAVNLGSPVNSPQDDYKPVPSADGRYLYFTSYNRYGHPGGEDIYRAEAQGPGWGRVERLPATVNGPRNESVNSLRADGQVISMYGSGSGPTPSGSVYFTEAEPGGWKVPQEYPAPINSPFYESDAFRTADGQALLFSSDRPRPGTPRGQGNHLNNSIWQGHIWGNTDVYVSLKTDSGWSDPINLGPTINTPWPERSAFLHPDGQTLYFSSAGHHSMGGMDVFVSRRLDPASWTAWSEPQSLGLGINTTADDWGYQITTDGHYAYYSRTSPSGSDFDIYRLLMPDSLRPKPVARLRGRVTNAQGKPLAAGIALDDLTHAKSLGLLNADPATGEYFVVLPLGQNYGLALDVPGYFPASGFLELAKRTTALDTTLNFVLQNLEELRSTGQTVRLNNLFFDFDKASLLPASHLELNRLLAVLQQNPTWQVVLEGHTDGKGTAEYNLRLSQQRAEAARQYLVQQGLNPGRVAVQGFGASRPVAGNDSEAGRALNRRVEARLK